MCARGALAWPAITRPRAARTAAAPLPLRRIAAAPARASAVSSPPPPQQHNRGLTDYVLRTGQPLFADPKVFQRLVEEGEVESRGAPSIDWVGVPLKSAEKTFGVLTV